MSSVIKDLDGRTELTEKLVNLASPELGGAICTVSDDFFAPAKRMLSASEPVFMADRYDDHGKWMDGWESRRKRTPGHDYCVIRICAGVIRRIEIDTRHFTGNFPPSASLDACQAGLEPDATTAWIQLLPRSDLEGDKRHFFSVSDKRRWTHVRLNIYPDGGIARLRVFGEPEQRENPVNREHWVDLVSLEAGGRALACNNMHFGHMDNLLSSRPVANMGDGWETRRRRKPGNDWVILELGRRACIARIELDTAFFRGNYPAHCSLKGAVAGPEDDIVTDSANWAEILPRVALGPDQLHIFERQLKQVGELSHVRLDIYPDGGVARLRLLGVPVGRAES